jgi:NUDIX domain
MVSETLSATGGELGERRSMMFGGEGVVRVVRCALVVRPTPWSYAREQAAAIDAHWQRRQAESRELFNGRIFVLTDESHDGDTYAATFTPVEFKAFLHWRETGYPETGVRDGFGSALLVSAEGHVLLGRQAAGHLNSGLAYPPGGFIDPRDVRGDGTIDIDASIDREIAEETGLPLAALRADPGYLVTRCGPHRSIARVYRSAETAAALQARVAATIAADPSPELDALVVVRNRHDMGVPMPDYARCLLTAVFADDRGDLPLPERRAVGQ